FVSFRTVSFASVLRFAFGPGALMRRVVSIAIILLVVGYFVNSCVQEERKETKARLEEEVKEQKVRDAVLGLQKRTGASAAWVDSLEGERHRRRDPVLTVELE